MNRHADVASSFPGLDIVTEAVYVAHISVVLSSSRFHTCKTRKNAFNFDPSSFSMKKCAS